MATKLEEKLARMTPAERKKAVNAISNMMGMMGRPEKKKPASKKKTTTKKGT